MRECLLKQSSIAESVAYPLLELGGRRAARPRLLRRRSNLGLSVLVGGIKRLLRYRILSGPAAHRTNVNSRSQRTDQGQRQIIQACSPSRIEKKMIWARPTMFSNGT